MPELKTQRHDPRCVKNATEDGENKEILDVLWNAVSAEGEKNEKVRFFLQDIAGTLTELHSHLRRGGQRCIDTRRRRTSR